MLLELLDRKMEDVAAWARRSSSALTWLPVAARMGRWRTGQPIVVKHVRRGIDESLVARPSR